MKTRKFLAFLGVAGILFTSCSDDDDNNPKPVSPEEVITTMTVTLAEGNEMITLNFFAPDGVDGSKDPTSSVSGDLKANTTYNGTITLLNATEEPAELVNKEIEEEANEHQFFYITNDLGITTSYADNECDYKETNCSQTAPVGLTFTLTTTNEVGNASLRVLLLHKLDKDAEGVANGDITNAGGSSDIDWPFALKVKE